MVLKEKVLIQKISWKRNQAFSKSRFRKVKSKNHHTLGEAEIATINAIHDKEIAEHLQHLKMSE